MRGCPSGPITDASFPSPNHSPRPLQLQDDWSHLEERLQDRTMARLPAFEDLRYAISTPTVIMNLSLSIRASTYEGTRVETFARIETT